MNGFNQTSTDISLEDGKELIDSGDLDFILRVTRDQRMLKNGLSAPYLLKWLMDYEQT